MEPLPYIDEHVMAVDAAADRVWTALTTVLRRTFTGGAPMARLLGCDPRHGTASFTGAPGEALPGFRVAEAETGRRVLLAGAHRFSRYRLEFRLGDGQVSARTYAAFPGVQGRAYRAAVIGTGAHRIVTRHLLREVVRTSNLDVDRIEQKFDTG